MNESEMEVDISNVHQVSQTTADEFEHSRETAKIRALQIQARSISFDSIKLLTLSLGMIFASHLYD